jgi:cytoskeletal protein CcmA (bactofilin family)
LKPTGVVAGDIIAARMTMAEGASINGHCQIGPDGKNKSAAVTETKPQQAKAPAQAAAAAK